MTRLPAKCSRLNIASRGGWSERHRPLRLFDESHLLTASIPAFGDAGGQIV